MANKKVAFKALKKLPIKKRVEEVKTAEGAGILASLTPTDFALLFPRYYQKGLPDVSGFRAAISKATQQQQDRFSQAVADKLGIDPETGRTKGGWMDKMSKDYAPGGRYAPGGKDYVKPLSPIEKTIKEKTGIDIAAGPTQAELKGDAKKLFEDLKAGRVPLDDPRAAVFKKMSPKDFAGSGLQIEDVNGKQYVKMAQVEVTEEQIKEKMTSGGNLKQMIDAAAKKNGIDPRIMYGIVRGESGHESIYDHNPGTKENPEDSWGSFQMNKLGGLGNNFQNETGLDVKDSKTLQAQTDWIAKEIAKRGGGEEARKWVASQWYGYGSNVGGPKEISARAAGGDSNWDSSWKSMGTTGRQASSPEEARRIIEEEQYQQRGQAFAAGAIETPPGLSGKALEEFKNMPPGEQQRFSDAFYKMGGSEEANKKINDLLQSGVDATASVGSSSIVEKQQSVAGVRTLPVKQELKTFLSYAAEKTGVMFEITSGGQTAGNKTGSNRHNIDNPGTIGAADGRLYVMEEGKKRYLNIENPNDIPLIQKFTKEFASVAPSAGVGTDYMAKGTPSQKELFHFGGGNYKGDNPIAYSGPEWFKKAHSEGSTSFGSKEIISEFNNWHDSKLRESQKTTDVKSITQDSVIEATPEEKKSVNEQIYRSESNPFGPKTAAEVLAEDKKRINDTTAVVEKPKPIEEKKQAGPQSFDLNRQGLINAIKKTDEYKKQTANVPDFLITDDAVVGGFFKDPATIKIMQKTGTTYDPATGKITSKNPDMLLKSFENMNTKNILTPVSEKQSAIEPKQQTATVGEKLQRELGVSPAQAGELTPEIRAKVEEQKKMVTQAPAPAPQAPTPAPATPAPTTQAPTPTPAPTAPTPAPAPQAGKPNETSQQNFLKSQGIGKAEPIPVKAVGGEVVTKGNVSAYPIGDLRGDNTVAVDTKTQQPLFTFNPQKEAVVPTGDNNRADVIPTRKSNAVGPTSNPITSQIQSMKEQMGEINTRMENFGPTGPAKEVGRVTETDSSQRPTPDTLNNLLHTGEKPYFNPTFRRAMSRATSGNETVDETGGNHFSFGTKSISQ